MNPIESLLNLITSKKDKPNMRDVAGESLYYKDLIDPKKTDDVTNNPYSYLTSQVNNNSDFTEWGSATDIALFNKIYKGLGNETPTTDSNYAFGSFIKDGTMLTTGQIKDKLSTYSSANKFDYDNLVRKGLINRTDNGEIKNYQDFLDNSSNYSVDSSIYDRIRNRQDEERALTTVGKELQSKDNSLLAGLFGGDAKVASNIISVAGAFGEGSDNLELDQNNGRLFLKATAENHAEYADQINKFKPNQYADYLDLLEKKEKNLKLNYSDPQLILDIAKTENKLFNKDGTVTLMDNMYEDHVNILKDAVANGNTSYALGQLTQLGIEFVPGIGMFGLGGVKKAAKIVYNGVEIALEFVPGTARLNAKTKANLTSKGISPKAMKAIEIKNAEAVIYARSEVPSSVTKAAIPPNLKKLTPEMAPFWKKSQELEIYKGKAWSDLTAEGRQNFKKKYERFAEKGISVDAVTITGNGKRLIYPETYNTKSPYPYARTSEVDGSRFKNSGVEFSHIENGKELEASFEKMVTGLYEYPMNGRDIPENVKKYIKLSEKFIYIEKYTNLHVCDENAWKHFVEYTKELDKNRGLSFKNTFPRLYQAVKKYGYE